MPVPVVWGDVPGDKVVARHKGVEGLPVLLIPGVTHGHVEAGQTPPQLHVLSSGDCLATLSLPTLKINTGG